MSTISDEQLQKEFEKIDKNNDKTITVEELRNYYLPMQELLGISRQLAELEIQGLVKRLDTDQNNQITFEEFKKFVSKK